MEPERIGPITPYSPPAGDSLESLDSVQTVSETGVISETPLAQPPTISQQFTPGPAAQPPHQFSPFKFNRGAFLITAGVAALIITIGIGTLLLSGNKANNAQLSSAEKINNYAVGNLSVQDVASNAALEVGQADHLEVNGQLKVSNTLVLAPTGVPKSPTPGQIYYDKTTNAPYYYNGSQFISMAPTATPQSVTSLGGSAGVLGLGNGLSITNNQLAISSNFLQNVTNAVNTPRVTSLQGLTGAVTLTGGPGIGISGTTITNNGVVGITAGTNIVITDNGNGNYTISDNSSGGAGQVALGPAAAQIDGTNASSIHINKTGTGNLLQFANNGTDVFVVNQNGQITTGTINYSQVQGAPATTVTSIAGNSGAFLLGAGLGNTGNTITNTGVVSITGTANQVIASAASGSLTLSLPQDIATTSIPVFGGEVLNGTLTVNSGGAVISAGGLTIGVSGTTTGLLNLANGANVNIATIQSGVLGQATTFTLPDPGGSSATICLSTGNCAGSGSGLTGVGTAGQLAKFSSSNNIVDSGLSESGNSLTYAGNLVVNAPLGFTGNLLNLAVNGSSKLTVDQLGNLIQAGTLTVNGGGASAISGSLSIGTGLTVTNGGLTVSSGGASITGPITLGSLGSGLVISSPGGVISSGAVDRNSATYFNTVLSAANGGTGTGSLTANGILYGNGTSPIQATAAAPNSILATNGSNVPGLTQTLPTAVQGNITGTGALASGSIASGFGTISTTNNITTTAGLQGGSLTVTGGSFTVDSSGNIVTTGTATIQGAGGLSIGVAGTTNGNLVFANSSNSHVTTLQGLAPAGQDQTIIIPASSVATDTVCLLTLANCVGSGSGVTASGGTQNYITKFTNAAANQLGNSLLFDDGTTVGIATNTPNNSFVLDVNGGTNISGNAVVGTGLTVTTGGATISGGGISVTGNSTISGTLTSLTGITSSGTITFSGLNTAGVVHTNGSGVLSTGAVALGTDTTGNYVNSIGVTTGLTVGGTNGVAGAVPTLSVIYGSGANTAAQGNTSISFNGTGNLTGTVSGTAGGGITTNTLALVNSPTFSGTLAVQGAGGITIGVPSTTAGVLNLANATNSNLSVITSAAPTGSGNATYTLPAIAGGSSDTICLLTLGNCSGASGAAGGDLTGTYPNPTIASLQGTTLTISSIASGDVLQYNGSAIVNGHITNSNLTAGTFTNITGTGALTAGSIGGSFGNINIGSNTFTGNGSGITNIDAANIATGTLADARLSTNVTVQGNTFNGASQLVQLNASTQLPAVSGVNLTNLNGSNIASGTVANARLVNSGALTVTAGTGLTGGGSVALGASTTLNVAYGSSASTAVEGNTSITCASGTGNLTGGGNTITLGSGGSCNNLTITNSPTFSGTLAVQGAGGITIGVPSTTAGVLNLANATNSNLSVITSAAPTGSGNATYTLPAIAGGSSDTICLLTLGNCSGASGAAGGDLTGTYPNPTIASLQGTTLTISSIASGDVLQYNGSAIVNGHITNSNLTAGTFTNITGTGALTAGSIGGSFGNINIGSNTFTGNGSGITNIDAANIATGTLADARLSTNVTVQGNTFNGASQLVQLNASTQLPAVSGVNLTNLNGSNIASGTVANARLVNSGALTVTAGTGLTGGGSVALGASTTLNVAYGSSASTAVEGNTSITCASGTGNLTGGGNTITLGSGGSCNNLTITNSPTFSGTLAVQGAGGITIGVPSTTAGVLNLANATNSNLSVITSAAPTGSGNATYTLPAIAGGSSDTICLLTLGNCSGASGAAGGDLTGTYPNPTIASLQGTTLTISSIASGDVLQYNGSAIVNGHITNSNLTAGTFTNITGTGALNAGSITSGFGSIDTGTDNITTSGALQGGTVNGATITSTTFNTATISGGTLSGGTVSGGTLTGTAVNSLNVSGTAISGSGTGLAISAGGAAQNLTLDGATTGQVLIGGTSTGNILLGGGSGSTGCTVTNSNGNLDCTGTINGATITSTTFNTATISGGTLSGGTLSGGTVSGGTLTASAVNSLNVGANAISTASGNLTVDANSTGTISLGATSTGDILLGGGSGSTGCTVTNSTGAFACSAGLQGTTLTATAANGLTLGTSSSATGGIVFKGSGGTGTLTLQGPTTPNAGNYTLSIPAITANDTICTFALANCAGVGGGITGSGTPGNLAKFNTSSSVADSTLSESGSTVTASGNLVIQGANSLSLGTASSNTGAIAFKNATNGNTVTLASGVSGSNFTLTLPTTAGANGDCLQSNGSGVLSFAACTGGVGGGVTSLDGETGVLTLANSTGLSGVITIDNASTSQKGIAQFNSTNFTDNGSGTINTVQNINSTAAPTFDGLTLTSAGATIAGTTLINTTGSASTTLGSATSGTSIGGTLGVTGITTLTGLLNANGGIATGGANINAGAGTITSGAINGQTINTASTFTGTVAIQGANALTLGTSATNTGAVVFKGSGGTGTLTLQGPTTPNAGNYTLSIPAITANDTICTLALGNCSFSGSTAGGDLTGTYPNPTIAKLQGTTLTISSIASGDVLQYNGSAIVNGHITNSNLTAGTFTNITGTGALNAGSITSGFGSIDTGTDNITTSGALQGGTVNGATITSTTFNTATISGGTLSGGTVSGGTLTGTAVNSLNVSGTAISGSGTGLAISAGGAAQNLTLDGATTGQVLIGGTSTGNILLGGGSGSTGCTVTNSNGNLDCTGTINGATITSTTFNTATISGGTLSGGTLSGGTVSGGTLTASAVNSLNVGANAISTASGNLTVDANSTGTISLGATSTGDILLGGGSGSTGCTVTNSTGAFACSAGLQGTTLTATAANGLTLGTSSSATGGIVFKGSGGTGTLTLQGPTTPNAGNYTLSIPAITANDTICTLALGNCSFSGSTAGGDLTGTYPNPTIAKLQGTTLTISSIASGDVLQYNGSAIVNGHITNSNLTAGTFTNITGTGALNAGSITSGFGSIDTGTDNITTSGALQGGTVNGATITSTTFNTATISGGTLSGGTVSGGTLTGTAVNSLNVSGTAISGSGTGLAISAGGAAQNLTLDGATTGQVLIGGTSTGNILLGGGSGSTGCTVTNSNGNLDCTGTINGATITSTTFNTATISGGTLSGGTLSGGTVSGGTLTASAVNSLNVGANAISTASGNLTVDANSTGTISLGATSTGDILLGGGSGSTGCTVTNSTGAFACSAGLQGTTLTATAANGLTLGTSSSATGGIVFKGSGGTGTLTLQGPTTPNAGNYTLSIPAITANDTICTLTLGNCSGASGAAGGDLTGTYPNPTIASLQGTTLTISSIASGDVLQYNGSAIVNGHITNTNLSAGTFTNITGTGALNAGSITSGFGSIDTGTDNITTSGALQGGTVNGATITSTTFNTATISGGTLSGGTVSGGTLTGTAVNSLNVSGTAISGSGTGLAISAGGAAQNLTLDGATTGQVLIGGTSTGNILLGGGSGSTGCTVTNSNGNLDCTGTINGATITSTTFNTATISGGTLSGGTLSGGTVSGGTLTASAVNSLNVGANAISTASGNLTVDANSTGTISLGATSTGDILLGGGSGSTGCTVTNSNGNLVCTGTINGATLSGGTLTGTAVNSLNVSGTAISGSGTGLAISAGGAAQNLTLDGATTGQVLIGGTSTGNILLGGGSGSTGCTVTNSNGNLDCTGTINGATITSTTFNTATISGGTLSGGTLSGGTVSGGTLTASAVNSLNVGANAISTASGNLTVDANSTGTISLGATSTGDILLGGGSGSTGCTVTNSTGAFACSAGLQGTTLTATAANGLTLGTSSSATGGIVFKGSGGTGTLTLQGPTTPNAGNYTLSIPAITANDTICTFALANCAGVGGGITGSGTPGNLAKFNTSSSVADSGLSEAGTTLTYAGNAVVNTANGFTGNILNLQVNSSSKYSVNELGNSTQAGTLTVNGTGTSAIAGSLTVATGLTVTAGGAGITGATTVAGGAVQINNNSNNNTSINTGTSTGAITLGNNLAGTISAQSANAINLTAGAASTIQTSAGNLTLQAGSGTVSLGSSTVLTASGALAVAAGGAAQNLTLNGSTTGLVQIGATSTGNIELGGGSGSTGCTLDNSTGNLACTGTITTTATNGTVGYWTRSGGNTLQPANAGDAITTTGNISTTSTGTITSAGLLTGQLGATISGAAISLNASSNFATNINTGSSTGAVAIGNSSNSANTTTIEAGTAASAIQIGNGATAHGIQIGSNATGDNDILLGGANAGSTLTLEAGTAGTAIQIGNGATAHGIQIGTGAAVQTVVIGSTNSTSALTLQAGTGNLNIGNDSVAKTTTINIGAEATGADVVAVGSANASSTLILEAGTGASAAQIFNGATAHTVQIATGAAVQGVTIGSTNSTSALTLQAGTGNLNIGNDSVAKTTTINIGAEATGADVVAVGSANASSTLILEAGTGASAAQIFNGATAHTVQIATGAAVQGVTIGSTNSTSALTLQAGTGNLNIGNDSVAKTTTINIGAQATGADLVAVGSSNASSTTTIEAGTAASAIQIGNGATAHGIQIGSNATGDNDILLGGANAGSTLTLEAGTAGTAIQIGNGATAHGIQIGTGAAVQTVVIGSTNSTSALTLQAGTGNLNIGNDSVAKTTTINIGAEATGADVVAVGSANASSTLILEAGTGASAAQIFNGATAHTVQIATGAAVQGVTLGSLNTTSTTTIQGGTGAGGITLTAAGSSSTGVVVKNSNNSTAAFQIQNTSSASLLTADTTNTRINVTGDVNVGTRFGSRLFSDNFESGNLNLWDQGATGPITADTAIVHDGKYAAKINPAANQAHVEARLAPNSTVYARAWVYVSSQTSSSADLLTIGDSSLTNYWTVFRNGSAVHLWNGVGAGSDVGNGGSFTTGAWHLIEMRITKGAGTGTSQVWFDGTQIINLTSQANGTNDIATLKLGDASGRTFTAYTDDVSTDTVTTGTSSSLSVDDSLHVGGTASFGSNVLIQPASNSTKAFQVQNNAGSAVLTVDTSQSYAGVAVGSAGLTGGSEIAFFEGGSERWDIGATNDPASLGGVDSYYLYNNTQGKYVFGVDTNGAATFRNSTNTASAFQVQNSTGTSALNVDTTKMTTTFQAGTDVATLGTELFTSGTSFTSGSGWTSNGLTGQSALITHTTGTTAKSPTPAIGIANGQNYVVSWDVTNPNDGGTLSVTLGGQTLRTYAFDSNDSGTFTFSDSAMVTTSSTTNLAFTPNSAFTGKVSNISIKAITYNQAPALALKNASGTIVAEMRASSDFNSLFLGLGTGASNVTGFGNVGVGTFSFTNNVSGHENTALGSGSLQSNISGAYNVGLGFAALNSNTSGDNNVGIGAYALNSNIQGAGNVAVGSNALQSNIDGYDNVAIGHFAVSSATTANYNVGIGTFALTNATTANSSVAIGYSALRDANTNYNNNAVGVFALEHNSGGSDNTALGTQALVTNNTGSQNVALGNYALFDNTSGFSNTAVGTSALSGNLTGSYNTALGRESGVLYDDLQRATVIGAEAEIGANNTVVLGFSQGRSVDDHVAIGSSFAPNSLTVKSKTYGTDGSSGTSTTIRQDNGSACTPGTTVTGTGTSFNTGMVGGTIYYADHTTATITGFTSTTVLTASVSKCVAAGSTYNIVYGGFNVKNDGSLLIQPTTDSTTALNVKTALGDVDVLTVDTVNGRVGVGAAPASGVEFYVQAASDSVIRGKGTGSNNLLELQNNSTTVLTVNNAGQLQLSTTGSTGGLTIGADVALYRSNASELSLGSNDSVVIPGGNLTVTNTVTTGTVVSIADSAAAQTTSTLLSVASSGYTTGYTGNIVNFTGTGTTGAGNVLHVANNAINGSGTALLVDSSTTGALTNGVARFNASANHTGNVVTIQSASTAGTGLSITDSVASQTTTRLLDIVSSGYTTGYTGNIVNISGTSTSGAGNLVNLSFAASTAGVALNVSSGATTITNTGAAIRIANGNILDLASGANGNTAVLKIPQKATNGACAGAGAEGLRIANTGGTQVGHICIDGPSAATPNKLRFYAEQFNATSTDVAENYTDANNNLVAGDLVALDSNGPVKSIVKATSANQAQLLGIVSTSPGILLSDIAEDGSSSISNPKPVALSGRVPTSVSSENGPIAVGDYLTISSTPGVGMKATDAGMVIGRALESYSGAGTGTILVFAQAQHYSGQSMAGYIQNGSNADLGNAAVSGLLTANDIQANGTATVNSLVAATANIQNLTTDNSITNSLNVSGNATIGNLVATGTVTVTDLTATGAATINTLTVTSLSATSAAIGSLTVSGSVTTGNLTVTGSATIGILTVTGNAHIGGNILIDGHIVTAGGVPIGNILTAAGSGATVNVDGNDTSGTITITTGTTGIAAGDLSKIDFSKVFTKTPKILLSGQDDNSVNAKIYPKGKTLNDFMISTGQALAPGTTYTFDYFIVE